MALSFIGAMARQLIARRSLAFATLGRLDTVLSK
jgi:hypothetical protein